MKKINIKGSIRRKDYLSKPVYFSGSEFFSGVKKVQFNNRDIEIEYVYDIDFELNRKITDQEYVQMQNVLNSIFVCYGDRACEGIFLWESMIHTYTGLIDFMHDGDISVNYIAKRYLMAKGKDIFFSSDLEVFVDNNQAEALV